MKNRYSKNLLMVFLSGLISFSSFGFPSSGISQDRCSCCVSNTPEKECCCRDTHQDENQDKNKPGDRCHCTVQPADSKPFVLATSVSRSVPFPALANATLFPVYRPRDFYVSHPYIHSPPPAHFPRLTIPLLV